MVEVNFKVQGDLIGLSSEVVNLTGKTVTLDDGTTHECNNGATFLAVDTSDVYILYNTTWYKL